MQELSVGLKLSDRLADAGQRYFNLAVNMNFVQGRRTQYVSAACLYAACRMNKTQHMLIDFSDILQVRPYACYNVYCSQLSTTRRLTSSCSARPTSS